MFPFTSLKLTEFGGLDGCQVSDCTPDPKHSIFERNSGNTQAENNNNELQKNPPFVKSFAVRKINKTPGDLRDILYPLTLFKMRFHGKKAGFVQQKCRQVKVNTAARRNLATHSDLLVGQKNITHQKSRETIETMIRNAIDTFRITTPAVNRKLARRSRIETTTSNTRQIDLPIMYF